MSTPKHTPGPWLIGLGMGNKHELDVGNISHDDPVCQIVVCDRSPDNPDHMNPFIGETTYANAALIAAAPELLKALERMHHHATHCWETNCDESNEVIKQALGALNKAKGGR